jgi:uncharacterized membrane protein YbhN (UPF0104 family)
MHQTLRNLGSLAEQRWVKNAVVAAGLGLSFLVIGKIVYRNWSQFQAFSWQLNPWPLAGAAVALVFAFGLNTATWYLISRAFGSQLGFWKDVEIYSFSTVVRRLPGAIWQIAGRTYLYHQAKTTLAVPLWGSLWEYVVQISSGVLLLALSLALSPQFRTGFPGGAWWLLLLIPVGWFLLRPQDVVSLAKLVSSRVNSQPNLTRQSVSMWVALYLLSWVLGGAILYFLLSALAPQSWASLPICVGLVATSGVLAILAAPIPGGLGIREISLVLLLGLYVPSPVAVAGSVLLRLWIFVGEALLALLVFLAARNRG